MAHWRREQAAARAAIARDMAKRGAPVDQIRAALQRKGSTSPTTEAINAIHANEMARSKKERKNQPWEFDVWKPKIKPTEWGVSVPVEWIEDDRYDIWREMRDRLMREMREAQQRQAEEAWRWATQGSPPPPSDEDRRTTLPIYPSRMKDGDWPFELDPDGFVKRETDMAILVLVANDTREVWIPKSVLKHDCKVRKLGDRGAVVVARWWARRNNYYQEDL